MTTYKARDPENFGHFENKFDFFQLRITSGAKKFWISFLDWKLSR